MSINCLGVKHLKKVEIKMQELNDRGLDPPIVFVRPIPNPESAKKKVRNQMFAITLKRLKWYHYNPSFNTTVGTATF